jgi:mRNA-degrading endonuclease RelE of RelBE toxin-antitoxin system
MHNLNVNKTDYFDKLVKKLSKKYRNIDNDIDYFLDEIEDIKDLGVSLGNNIYKARIKNSDNNKGKSAGYRLITYLQLNEDELTLLYIYSKSELENIKEAVLDKVIIDTFSQSK